MACNIYKITSNAYLSSARTKPPSCCNSLGTS